MHDEWRLTIEAAEDADELEDALRLAAAGDVGVSRSGSTIFIYGGSRPLVEDLVSPELKATAHLHRWHPVDGWVEPGAWTEPLAVELVDEWIVVARLDRQDDARELAQELHHQGRTASLHHRVAVAGLTAQEAQRLGERIKLNAPQSTRIEVRRRADMEDDGQWWANPPGSSGW
jgi:hypothetical protein